MRTSSVLTHGAIERLAYIDGVLDTTYRAPEADLGNKTDPLEECIYIILSFQTNLARVATIWTRLREGYPVWEQLKRARTRDVARVLREGGLHVQKARTIKRLLNEVQRLSGELSLDLTQSMNDEDAEKFLLGLPGVSWKAARCVLLYSLRRDVFPVDSNTFRILKRTGILSTQTVYRRRAVHDTIQSIVPASRRRALHVNLVVHGQRTCLPRAPRCQHCPLIVVCPMVGVSRRERNSIKTLEIPGGESGAGALLSLATQN